MRNSNEESLSSVIGKILKDNHLEEGLLEVRIQDAWNKLMDPSILQRTASVRLLNGVLEIRTLSAALAHELSYQADEIRIALNTAINSQAILKVTIR